MSDEAERYPSPRVRIVVAEDEAIIRLDLTETLIEEGYDVVGAAADGAEALRVISETAPDVAILDIKMPEMDGIEVARRLAAQGEVAVVVLTAFSQRRLVEEARDAGALAYLGKPFNRSDIIPAVEIALARHREFRAINAQVETLAEQLRVRKLLDRAKGLLIDAHKLSEQDAFSFIQRTAMDERSTMADVAERVVDGSLAP
ncbi:MAG: response regulator [Acidobacteria bacterium]|nr:response regulator [Acidobacteriota bacterium]